MLQDVIGIIHQCDLGPEIQLGDVSDALSSRWTFVLTIGFAALMTFRTYVLSPIQCNTNSIAYNQKSLDFGAFVNSYCFVKGTMAKMDGQLNEFHLKATKGLTGEKGRHIEYYPWIPLYLGIIALLPCLISIVWNLIWSRQTGGQLRSLIHACYRTRLLCGEERRKNVERISRCIADSLWMERQINEKRFGKSTICVGSCLNFGYIIVKVTYLISHVVSVVTMHSFLGIGRKDVYFGFQFIARIVRGNFSETARIFPRFTWCRLPVKSEHFENFQCVLSGNIFSEITFAILWIWHVSLFSIMIISLLLCLWRTLKKHAGDDFLRRGLTLRKGVDFDEEEIKDRFQMFSRHFIQQDGRFVLCMIDKVVGSFVTDEVIVALWERYERTHDCLSLPRPCGGVETYRILQKDSMSCGLNLEPQNLEHVV